MRNLGERIEVVGAEEEGKLAGNQRQEDDTDGPDIDRGRLLRDPQQHFGRTETSRAGSRRCRPTPFHRLFLLSILCDFLIKKKEIPWVVVDFERLVGVDVIR